MKKSVALVRRAGTVLLFGASVLAVGLIAFASVLTIHLCDSHFTLNVSYGTGLVSLTEPEKNDACAAHVKDTDDCNHCHTCEYVPLTIDLLAPVAARADDGLCHALASLPAQWRPVTCFDERAVRMRPDLPLDRCSAIDTLDSIRLLI